jgi:hypothetical protein
MTLQGLLLGIINIAIVVAIFLLVGAIIMWFCSWMSIAVPANVQKGYIAVVALIALYMLVALLFGIPTIRVITSESDLQRTSRIAAETTSHAAIATIGQ